VFKKVDLNKEFEIINACIVYSIFTMQFLDKSSRFNFCKTIYDGLNIGGVFILCEKIYQEDGFMQEILTFSHYDYKKKYFTDDELFSKERDLRFIMKPNKFSENISLLQSVGFKIITQFWQSYNFVGLIAIK
jgi:tRNA (cmo5U34)-methyltransferase